MELLRQGDVGDDDGVQSGRVVLDALVGVALHVVLELLGGAIVLPGLGVGLGSDAAGVRTGRRLNWSLLEVVMLSLHSCHIPKR